MAFKLRGVRTLNTLSRNLWSKAGSRLGVGHDDRADVPTFDDRTALPHCRPLERHHGVPHLGMSGHAGDGGRDLGAPDVVLDVLGEACLSEDEADGYQRRYLQLVERLGAEVPGAILASRSPTRPDRSFPENPTRYPPSRIPPSWHPRCSTTYVARRRGRGRTERPDRARAGQDGGEALMLEIRWHARGGQGAVTAAKAFAEAALEEGKYIQAMPEYGPERSGAPIRAYNRVSTVPIRFHSQVTTPGVVVDATLVGTEDVLAGTSGTATLLINSEESPRALRERLQMAGRQLYTLNASQIALEELGRNFPNTPLLGALARVTEVVGDEWRLSYMPREKRPVAECLEAQGRFRHLLRPDS